MTPVIISGGVGARLWPISRVTHPKPFIELADGQTLLQKAFLRGLKGSQSHNTLTVTNQALYFKTLADYDKVAPQGVHHHFILEPQGRNTAAALAAAALEIQREHGGEQLMLVLPADHLVEDLSAFQTSVERARVLANEGWLVTFGIKPLTPETGYGYIEKEGHRVIRFVEKPSGKDARQFLESGRFLWNAGMFCFQAKILLQEMRQHCPQVLEAVEASIGQSVRRVTDQQHCLHLDADSFSRVPEDSIDYAVMERSNRVATVEADIGWSDVGNWAVLGSLGPADKHGNRTRGAVYTHGSQNCTIHSDHRVVGAVGVQDLMIIDTPDALLVSHRDRAQDVKHLFASLKSNDCNTHLHHRTESRPWGRYTVLEERANYKIKRIEVQPGGCLSLQRHAHRCEHWIFVSGQAQVTQGHNVSHVKPRDTVFIAAGQEHRLFNPSSTETVVMIEVQTGTYLGEDDIVRLEDVYGRVA